VKGNNRRFEPSWIDRFNNRVEKLPIRFWIFYAIFGLVLIAIQVFILWLEGGFQNGELMPVIIFNSLFTPFLLGLIHFLDQQAMTSLKTIKPALEISEADFNDYKFKLSNMPSALPLAAGLTMLIFVILMEQYSATPVRYEVLEDFRIFRIIFQIIDKSSAFLFGIFIYHTIRQLRFVNTINSTYIKINLFNIRPLQAFSRLTASTSAGLVMGVYGWMLINPELFSDPAIIGFILVITILAVSVFLWPLYGAHKRMVVAKENALHEIDQLSESVYSKFNNGLQDGDYSAIESLNGTIGSLDIQYKWVKAIPTWPWKPETAQLLLTAIALPLVLAILRFLIEQAFDL
jgi:hypothetical protein